MAQGLGDLGRLIDQAATFVSELPADRIEGAQALTLVKMFESLRRTADAGHALAAEAVRRSGIASERGEPDATTLIARETRTTKAAAGNAIRLGQALERSGATREALVSGTVDAGLARDIAEAAEADPAAAEALLAAAADPDVPRGEIRDQARRVAAGWRPEERAARAHRRRSLTWGVLSDGTAYASLKTTPEVLAELTAAINPYVEESVRTHRKERTGASTEQIRADALEAMVADVRAGRCGRGGPRAVVSLRVDAAALMRGHVEGDEVCEVPGIGPISVEHAKALLGDAAVELVIRRGKAIATTCTLGRTMPAGLRTAVFERDGRRCVVPGCGNRFGLEIDHMQPLAQFGGGGKTELSNLAALCRFHHQQKTRGHRTLHRGPDGTWRWETTRRGELEADLQLPAWDRDPEPPSAPPPPHPSPPPEPASTDARARAEATPPAGSPPVRDEASRSAPYTDGPSTPRRSSDPPSAAAPAEAEQLAFTG